MQEGNSREMGIILKQYKTKEGIVDFPAVLSVPVEDRIAVMAKNDFNSVNLLIIGALTMAFEKINFKKSVNEFQVLDMAEAIIDEAEQDNLSMEDLLLFLQGMVRGKYQFSKDSIDTGRFLETFEQYRQERYEALLQYRENKHLELKGLGSSERSYKEDPLDEHFARLGNTINGLKESLKEVRKENQNLKDIDNF